MTRIILVAALTLSVLAVAGEITNNFVKTGSLKTGPVATDAGTAPTGNGGPLVKVVCPSDAYVGASALDAGTFNSCAPLADGGIPCDVTWFSQYQKFYVKMLAGQDHVSAYMLDAGVETCTTFEARN